MNTQPATGSRYFLATCANTSCPAHVDGYKLRMTRIHVEHHGPPLCPECQEPMDYEADVAA